MAQGTIYPDRIESLNITGKTIKRHHNVGGLPEEMNLRLCEPLQWLFKDEVRRVGREWGMPEHLITRHPFPGPGLAVRILGDITPEKVHTLQEADDIFIQGLRDWKVQDADGNETSLYHQVWQAGVILLPVQSVGVMGDERTYERAVALRAVTSTDAMTADWAHLPYEFMAKVSNDIINKVKEEVGLENVKTVVTGGLGRIIANETTCIDIYDPNLTLKGIYRVYKKQNRKIK